MTEQISLFMTILATWKGANALNCNYTIEYCTIPYCHTIPLNKQVA